MIVTGHPQFETQDDDGIGSGIPPIPEWQHDRPTDDDDLQDLTDAEIDHEVAEVFLRLRFVLRRTERVPLSTTKLHDLTCFVGHRLLLSAPETTALTSSPATECMRYGVVIHMFLIQGTTYFSHAVLLEALVTRLMENILLLESVRPPRGSFDVWCLAVGLAASAGTGNYRWFWERSLALATSQQLDGWGDILNRMKSILWFETPQSENIFRPHWDALLGLMDPLTPVNALVPVSHNLSGSLVSPSRYTSPSAL